MGCRNEEKKNKGSDGDIDGDASKRDMKNDMKLMKKKEGKAAITGIDQAWSTQRWTKSKKKKWKRADGQWTKHKYQNLFDLVKLDLQVKAYQNYDAGNRQFRDNIVWEDISEKLTTRNRENCCIKWLVLSYIQASYCVLKT
uniref:Myb/SANT-like domain-containing protein n=1 Tax=Oryza barthii TaxID=65489 RepID=A0A0D3G4D1_9ORYZ